MKLRNPFWAVICNLPVILFWSAFACATGYFVFHVSLEQLGVVASVPLVIGFVFTRIMRMFIPKPPEPPRKPLKRELVGTFFIFSGTLGCIVFLFSSIPYAVIGLRFAAIGALKASLWLFVFSVSMLVITALATLTAEIPLRRLIKALARRLFWSLTKLRNDDSYRLFGHMPG